MAKKYYLYNTNTGKFMAYKYVGTDRASSGVNWVDFSHEHKIILDSDIVDSPQALTMFITHDLRLPLIHEFSDIRVVPASWGGDPDFMAAEYTLESCMLP